MRPYVCRQAQRKESVAVPFCTLSPNGCWPRSAKHVNRLNTRTRNKNHCESKTRKHERKSEIATDPGKRPIRTGERQIREAQQKIGRHDVKPITLEQVQEMRRQSQNRVQQIKNATEMLKTQRSEPETRRKIQTTRQEITENQTSHQKTQRHIRKW